MENKNNNHQFNNTDSVVQVLELIGSQRNWTREDIDNDLNILKNNRIVQVQDLKALSKESWGQIELLPLVKDLLRDAIGANGNEGKEEKNNKKNNNNNNRKKKKQKEDKGFISPSPLGTPVVPTVLKPPPVPVTVLSDEEDISHDHLTIQNTIFNGTNNINSSTEEDSDEEILSPSGAVRRKSVSFSGETTTIGVAAGEKKKKDKKKKDKKKKKKENETDDDVVLEK